MPWLLVLAAAAIGTALVATSKPGVQGVITSVRFDTPGTVSYDVTTASGAVFPGIPEMFLS